MSKSAPVTPTKAFKKASFFESRLRVRFDERVLVYSINKPPYPEGIYPWEDRTLPERNIEMANKNIKPETDSDSDSQEPASPKAALSFPPYNSVDANADYDEQKERSDDEESESYINSEPEEGDDEGDYEAYEGDEGEYEGDYEDNECSVSESEQPLEVKFEPCGKRGRDEDFKTPQEHEAGGFNPKYYKSESAQSLNNNRVPSTEVFLEAYEEGALFFPAPLSPEVLDSSSSSASASPSDCGSPVLADSPASPFPPVLEVSPESKECSDDELSWEEIAAQRESGTAPRGEWEVEDDLCRFFSGAVISQDVLQPSCAPVAAAPVEAVGEVVSVEAAGEAMQFGAD